MVNLVQLHPELSRYVDGKWEGPIREPMQVIRLYINDHYQCESITHNVVHECHSLLFALLILKN